MCPSADKLVEFAAGRLTDDQAATIESHIDTCSDCRGALSNLARGDEPPSFGRYRIDTVLGSGGMGIVYRAFDPQLGRPVAIKVVKRAGDDAASRARLEREARSLARVSHPNVCHVYDVGTEGEEVWVAMELIDGVSLRQWAGERRAPGELLGVLVGAAEGIAAAHAAGIVHRDVKPENVLVGRDGRPIVTDFGLARPQDVVDPIASTISTDENLTQSGAIAGTPAYLAPEQLTGDPIDAKVDQFAWAVMAWELMTGVRPFPVVFAARLEAIRAGVTPPPGLSKVVAGALAKAMAVASRDRFASMRELIDAVKAAPVAETEKKPAAKRRVAAIAAAAVLVGGTGVVLIKSSRTGSATREPSPSPSPPPPTAPATVDRQPSPPPTTVDRPPPPPPPAPAAAAPEKRETGNGQQAIGRKPGTGNRVPGTGNSEERTQRLVEREPSSIAPAVGRTRFARGNAIAVMSSFCHVPYDFAKPDPATGTPIADWGKVTSVAREIGRIGDRETSVNVVTIAGQRGTYRVDDDFGALGVLPASPGDLVAICVEDEGNAYQLTGGPLTLTHAAIPLSRAPRTTEIAKLQPLHVSWGALMASPATGKPNVDPDRRYLVQDTVGAKDGNRFEMTHWTVEVPDGIPGAQLVSPGKVLWFVVEHPTAEDIGGQKHTVARAAAVIDNLFP